MKWHGRLQGLTVAIVLVILFSGEQSKAQDTDPLLRKTLVLPELIREVLARNPDVIIASWCGRKVEKKLIHARPEWKKMNAVRDGHVYEINSTYILQAGPAALTEGVRQLHAAIARAAGAAVDPDLQDRF